MLTVKGGRKLLSDACNEFLKGGLPIILKGIKYESSDEPEEDETIQNLL